jgi:hypothetical protein
MSMPKCPSCGSSVKIKLVPSTEAVMSTVPDALQIYGPGGDHQVHTYRTDRSISWNCTNKKCDQSKETSLLD